MIIFSRNLITVRNNGKLRTYAFSLIDEDQLNTIEHKKKNFTS